MFISMNYFSSSFIFVFVFLNIVLNCTLALECKNICTYNDIEKRNKEGGNFTISITINTNMNRGPSVSITFNYEIADYSRFNGE